MNEKGFFTVIGICFLLIAALAVKGVQESEYNYSYITTDFQTEVELQNIADSALMEAVDLIKNEKIPLEEPANPFRKDNQHEITDKIKIADEMLKDVNVRVFYEYGKIKNENEGTIYFAERKYSPENDVFYKEIMPSGKTEKVKRKGVIIISVAGREINGVKVYRRAIGYFLDDNEEIVKNNNGKPVIDKFRYGIHFMNSL